MINVEAMLENTGLVQSTENSSAFLPSDLFLFYFCAFVLPLLCIMVWLTSLLHLTKTE